MSTFSDLFDKASAAVSSATDSVKTTGVPALEASLEQWGSTVLGTMSSDTQKQLNQTLATQPAAPAGSFEAAFQSVLTNIGLNQGGGQILMLLAVAGIGGYLLLRR
ncbi:MAG: hypothetical protein ABI351_13870 [Herbaspirillum sp.]